MFFSTFFFYGVQKAKAFKIIRLVFHLRILSISFYYICCFYALQFIFVLHVKIFVWLIQSNRVGQPTGDLAGEKPGVAEHSFSEKHCILIQPVVAEPYIEASHS